jgi:hypothetical protein
LFQSPFYRVIYSYASGWYEYERAYRVSIPFLPGHLFLRFACVHSRSRWWTVSIPFLPGHLFLQFPPEGRGRRMRDSFNPLFTGSSIPTRRGEPELQRVILFQSPFYRVIYSYPSPSGWEARPKERFNPLFTGSSIPTGLGSPGGLKGGSCFNPLFTGSSIPTGGSFDAGVFFLLVSIPFLPGHLFLLGGRPVGGPGLP